MMPKHLVLNIATCNLSEHENVFTELNSQRNFVADHIKYDNYFRQFNSNDVSSVFLGINNRKLSNKSYLLNLLKDTYSKVDNYDLFVFVINGHGAYQGIQIDSYVKLRDTRNLFSPQEIFKMVKKIATKVECLLIINACNFLDESLNFETKVAWKEFQNNKQEFLLRPMNIFDFVKPEDKNEEPAKLIKKTLTEFDEVPDLKVQELAIEYCQKKEFNQVDINVAPNYKGKDIVLISASTGYTFMFSDANTPGFYFNENLLKMLNKNSMQHILNYLADNADCNYCPSISVLSNLAENPTDKYFEF